MAKSKIKYGKIDLPSNEFDSESASIRISMMLPLDFYKDLKALSLDNQYQGKYQVLIKDILKSYIDKNKKHSKSKKAS